jgi:hypothetical protein
MEIKLGGETPPPEKNIEIKQSQEQTDAILIGDIQNLMIEIRSYIDEMSQSTKQILEKAREDDPDKKIYLSLKERDDFTNQRAKLVTIFEALTGRKAEGEE